MRNPFRILILLLILLSACNVPSPGPTVTAPAPATDTATAPPSVTPLPDYTECGFTWARESLPDLSQEFDAALKATLPLAGGYAEAYGENCFNNQGEVVRFLAMQTDFYVTIQVEDLEDNQLLGILIEQVMAVVDRFPVDATPGPLPGYVGITFEASGEADRLWFPERDARAALENGLRGEELYGALNEK